MLDFKWKNEYEVGHERIDFEHRIFIDLAEKINNAVKAKKDKNYIERLLNELRAYTEFHFISEENIMYLINYPDYEKHKQQHRKLLDMYSQKLMEIDLGEQTIEDLIIFFKDWFLNHILDEDRRIASFVKGKYI